MGILTWLIFGGLVGWVASILTGKNDQMGIVSNIIIGIIGAFIGGFLAGKLLDLPDVTGFNLYSFLISLGGAVLLLFILNIVRKR